MDISESLILTSLVWRAWEETDRVLRETTRPCGKKETGDLS